MNSTVRNFLRKRAHMLQPIVMVGKQGPDSRIVQALDEALHIHELVKVKFQDFRDQRREIADSLSQQVGAEVVSIVGHIAILFRQNSIKEEQVVHIPRSLQQRNTL